jgi:hypothetical protein
VLNQMDTQVISNYAYNKLLDRSHELIQMVNEVRHGMLAYEDLDDVPPAIVDRETYKKEAKANISNKQGDAFVNGLLGGVAQRPNSKLFSSLYDNGLYNVGMQTALKNLKTLSVEEVTQEKKHIVD